MRAIDINDYPAVLAERQASKLEDKMTLILRAMAQDWPEMPAYEAEYRFHNKRRWRFDFAWPGAMLALEVEGGTWSGGRHVRGAGYAEDCIKYNAAAVDGWRVLRFTAGMLDDARYVERTIRAALEARP